jgi:calcineurin-like phosphoesterase family protein
VATAPNTLGKSFTVTRILFLGDTHNDLDFAENAAQLARQHSAEIVQCGDFGFLWPGKDQLEELSTMLTDLGVTLRFVDGNHDDHPRLRKHVSACVATTIAPNVIYQPRGSVHENEDGTRFLFLGGAPSIDRASRVPGESWWPEEGITDAEFDFAMCVRGPIHVLVTHDAPDYPPGFSPKGTPGYRRDQARSLKRGDSLIRRHRPALHVHGHWHSQYTRVHAIGTIVAGLNCNDLDSAYLDEGTLLWSRDVAQKNATP